MNHKMFADVRSPTPARGLSTTDRPNGQSA